MRLYISKYKELLLEFANLKPEEQNKKDNPKEIFYEFFKLFRKQILFATPPPDFQKFGGGVAKRKL
jgi:hypothetical protein